MLWLRNRLHHVCCTVLIDRWDAIWTLLYSSKPYSRSLGALEELSKTQQGSNDKSMSNALKNTKQADHLYTSACLCTGSSPRARRACPDDAAAGFAVGWRGGSEARLLTDSCGRDSISPPVATGAAGWAPWPCPCCCCFMRRSAWRSSSCRRWVSNSHILSNSA
jgi:hypothetical protein